MRFCENCGNERKHLAQGQRNNKGGAMERNVIVTIQWLAGGQDKSIGIHPLSYAKDMAEIIGGQWDYHRESCPLRTGFKVVLLDPVSYQIVDE